MPPWVAGSGLAFSCKQALRRVPAARTARAAASEMSTPYLARILPDLEDSIKQLSNTHNNNEAHVPATPAASAEPLAAPWPSILISTPGQTAPGPGSLSRTCRPGPHSGPRTPRPHSPALHFAGFYHPQRPGQGQQRSPSSSNFPLRSLRQRDTEEQGPGLGTRCKWGQDLHGLIADPGQEEEALHAHEPQRPAAVHSMVPSALPDSQRPWAAVSSLWNSWDRSRACIYALGSKPQERSLLLPTAHRWLGSWGPWQSPGSQDGWTGATKRDQSLHHGEPMRCLQLDSQADGKLTPSSVQPRTPSTPPPGAGISGFCPWASEGGLRVWPGQGGSQQAWRSPCL